MEKKSVRLNKKTGEPIKKQGGARPGAGRPKGSTEQVTIDGLLLALKDKSGGKPYEALLVEDFLQARTRGDSQLTVCWHFCTATCRTTTFVNQLSLVCFAGVLIDALTCFTT